MLVPFSTGWDLDLDSGQVSSPSQDKYRNRQPHIHTHTLGELLFSPMWYRPIQSVASTSSFMSHEMTRWPWPKVSWYTDAVSDERLSELTRSVSLLARCSPTPADSVWAPDNADKAEASSASCIARLLRPSGPTVYGRACGVRLRTARRCSRALPLGVEVIDGDEDEAVAAAAMTTEEVEENSGEKSGEVW